MGPSRSETSSELAYEALDEVCRAQGGPDLLGLVHEAQEVLWFVACDLCGFGIDAIPLLVKCAEGEESFVF